MEEKILKTGGKAFEDLAGVLARLDGNGAAVWEEAGDEESVFGLPFAGGDASGEQRSRARGAEELGQHLLILRSGKVRAGAEKMEE